MVYDVVIFVSVPGYDHVSHDSPDTVSTSNWHLFTQPLSLTNRYKHKTANISCSRKFRKHSTTDEIFPAFWNSLKHGKHFKIQSKGWNQWDGWDKNLWKYLQVLSPGTNWGASVWAELFCLIGMIPSLHGGGAAGTTHWSVSTQIRDNESQGGGVITRSHPQGPLQVPALAMTADAGGRGRCITSINIVTGAVKLFALAQVLKYSSNYSSSASLIVRYAENHKIQYKSWTLLKATD